MPRFRYSVFALAGAWLCLLPFSAAHAGVLVTIDKSAQQMTVEVDGARQWTWPVSTGRRGYDTPSGSFRPFRMEEDHYSKEWDEAPMPYSIFFTGDGHAIHGSYETRRLGHPASHGCVRISPANAARLFALVKREGLSNARVVVINDPNSPVAAKNRSPAAKVQQAKKLAPVQAPGAVATFPGSANPAAYSTSADQAYGYAPVFMEQPATNLPAEAATPFERRRR